MESKRGTLKQQVDENGIWIELGLYGERHSGRTVRVQGGINVEQRLPTRVISLTMHGSPLSICYPPQRLALDNHSL